MTTVARDYSYRDGSGVHRVVQRLEKKAEVDQALAGAPDVKDALTELGQERWALI